MNYNIKKGNKKHMKELDKNNCENCKYFTRYYVNRDGKFYPIRFGHCICERQRKYYLKNVSSSDTCVCFTAEEKEQIKTTIEKSLKNMWILLDQYLQTINLKGL